MKISYQWLKEFVDFEASPRKLADDLSMVGIVVETLEAQGDDFIMDLDLTTNRPDCLSHFGVAREVATTYQKKLKSTGTTLVQSPEPAKAEISVVIEAPSLCARYCARVLRGVRIEPSPPWLSSRLERLGIRSINNIVDATNYVLLELGHPLHAFDLAKISAKQIIVRSARAGEKLVTLDGIERELKPGMLIIADPSRPLAIAGIMGGLDSEIGSGARDVLLESAWFEPISIRKAAKDLGLHTEASHRFERGADINATVTAIDRTASLIQQVAGGEILQGIVDCYPEVVARNCLTLRRARISKLMGLQIDDSSVKKILTALNFEVTDDTDEGWRIQLPTSRPDVEREIDLIEEVARHYGYDRFPSTLPPWTGSGKRQPESLKEQILRQKLIDLGYSETLTYSFVDEGENKRFSSIEPVKIKNPLSSETGVMRTSLVTGLLHSFLQNYHRGIKSIQLFELGRIYPNSAHLADKVVSSKSDDDLSNRALAVIASGNVQEKTVHREARAWSFFDLKGDLEVLLKSLSLPLHRISWIGPNQGCRIPSHYHPSARAEFRLGDRSLGILGQMHPNACDHYKIKQPVFLMEIYLGAWLQSEVGESSVQEPMRFPAVQRDLSIVVDQAVDYGVIESSILKAGIPELRKCFPFDIYLGDKLAFGKKSISISIVYQAADRTLTDDEVARYHESITRLLDERLGAQLRA